jgi:hypothetical protein
MLQCYKIIIIVLKVLSQYKIKIVLRNCSVTTLEHGITTL